MSRSYIRPKDLLVKEDENALTFSSWFWHRGILVLEGIVIGVFLFFLYTSYFPSPMQRQLNHRLDDENAVITLLRQQQNEMQLVLTDLQQRDDNLYRVLFGAEPIPLAVRSGADHKLAYYEELASMSNNRMLKELINKTSSLATQLYIQAASYDTIVMMAKNQQIRMENIPAIQPVFNKDLKRVASGYGVRIDPVYHLKKFHHGMDFSAPVGTEVFATGNGTITFAGWKQGYGNTVVLDHGFGYTTLYAHLYKPVARKGQRVKRGDIIALVGNSGKSTGPHLHYEVRINDRPVDPRNYYFYDLSPEQYDLMLQLSNNQGNMLD